MNKLWIGAALALSVVPLSEADSLRDHKWVKSKQELPNSLVLHIADGNWRGNAWFSPAELDLAWAIATEYCAEKAARVPILHKVIDGGILAPEGMHFRCVTKEGCYEASQARADKA